MATQAYSDCNSEVSTPVDILRFSPVVRRPQTASSTWQVLALPHTWAGAARGSPASARTCPAMRSLPHLCPLPVQGLKGPLPMTGARRSTGRGMVTSFPCSTSPSCLVTPPSGMWRTFMSSSAPCQVGVVLHYCWYFLSAST